MSILGDGLNPGLRNEPRVPPAPGRAEGGAAECRRFKPAEADTEAGLVRPAVAISDLKRSGVADVQPTVVEER